MSERLVLFPRKWTCLIQLFIKDDIEAIVVCNDYKKMQKSAKREKNIKNSFKIDGFGSKQDCEKL